MSFSSIIQNFVKFFFSPVIPKKNVRGFILTPLLRFLRAKLACVVLQMAVKEVFETDF